MHLQGMEHARIKRLQLVLRRTLDPYPIQFLRPRPARPVRSSSVPSGISLSKFLLACSTEMNDTPTRTPTCFVPSPKRMKPESSGPAASVAPSCTVPFCAIPKPAKAWSNRATKYADQTVVPRFGSTMKFWRSGLLPEISRGAESMVMVPLG